MPSEEINKDDQQLAAFGYTPVLARKLSLWRLVSFGLNYLQPIGQAIIFGAMLTASGGTVVLPCILAFIGMIFTLYSYIILSKKFPLTGSIYSYVQQIMGKKISFIAGWLLMLDYILIPTINTASAANYINAMYPSINFETILIALTCFMMIVNLIGIRLTATISSIILLTQLAAVFGFIVLAIVWTHHTSSISLISSRPFQFNSISGLLEASGIAVFGYLGFDAITTMAEESKNPTVNIPKAMLICLISGSIMICLVAYLGTLVIPQWHELFAKNSAWSNATLFQVSNLIGGKEFSLLFTYAFILAMITTNIVGTAAAARLLFGMGRDRVLPASIFSKVHIRWKTPYNNIILLSIISIAIGSLESVNDIAELINYGAIGSFILLNLSVVIFFIKDKDKFSWHIALPAIGLLIMLLIFLNIAKVTLFFGSLWLLLGVIIMVTKLKR